MGIRETLNRWFPPDSGNYVARNMPGLIEHRDALGAMQIAYQIGKPQYPNRNAAVYDEEAYRKISLVFRCINVIANSIGTAPIRVYQETGGQMERLDDHPLRKLMERPNPNMGETVFMATVATTMAATGFCVIEKERAAYGRVVGLWPLRSDWLASIPRSDGKADWKYKIPGRDAATLMAEDVIVLTYASTPSYSLTGVGPLEVALSQWALLSTMSDWLKAFFDQGAMPTYGLVLADGVTLKPADAELIRTEWTNRYSGWRGGQSAPPILQTIKDIKRLSFDFNELALTEIRDLNEIAICQAFGIPGSMVGQRFAQERNTFTNYGEARLSFYQDTIIPLWSRLDDNFTRSLLPDFDQRPNVSLAFDTSDVQALQEDLTPKWDRARQGMSAGGITVNEYRNEIGMPPLPDAVGNVLYRPLFVMPIDMKGNELAESSGVPPGAAGGRSFVNVRGEIVTELPAHEVRAIGPGDRRARGLVTLDTRTAIEERAKRVYTNSAKRYAPKIQAFFDAQKERVLGLSERSAQYDELIASYLGQERLKVLLDRPLNGRVSEGHKQLAEQQTRAVNDLLNIDWQYEDNELDALIRQLWDLMGGKATAQANDVLRDADLTWDISNPWVREVLEEVATRVVDINATTRDDIRRVVNDALAEGVSMPELSDRLEGLYDETYSGRSMTIARTESQVAYNHAQIAGYRESGLVDQAELLDNPAHDTDPGSDGLTCAQRDGLIVSLDEIPFHIAAEHPNGSLAVAPVLSTPLGVV